MTTPTTIRLDAKLKKRLERLAEQLDRSTHGLMLEGIERMVEAVEERLLLAREAARRSADFDRRHVGYSLDDLAPWFEGVARGQNPAMPRPRRLRR
ncbi:MAG: ribbon-helix-helix domain-containing protein [Myxococcaceae bacterium]